MTASPVRPSLDYKRAFLAMVSDLETEDPEKAEFYAPAKCDFRAYVRSLTDEERGLNLRAGWVPCTHRWLVSSLGAVVGVTRLRHNIDTPFLASDGGHIGYDVAPSHRGHGYGHLALRVALAEAAYLRIPRVLLCTAADNVSSRRIIERQGGELEAVAFSEFWRKKLCSYWIEVKNGT